MIIYGDTNAKISHNRIKWNIKATTEVPTSETPGQIGDILIVTSSAELVKKIKYVATKAITDTDLQNNSINVYEDFTRDRVLVNRNNGFNMYIWATQQNIMVNGEVMIANVFFYDGLTNSWKQYNSAYKEALNVNSFTGANISVDELWSLSYTDSLNEGRLLPPMHREQIADSFTAETFVGTGLDVDTLYPGWDLSEDLIVNNLTIV
jgi:hypothetical protein